MAETPEGGAGNGVPEDQPGLYGGPRAYDPPPADGHDDPEFVTRTRFLTGVAVATGAVMTAAIMVPVIGFAVAPTLKEEEWRWVDIGPLSTYPAGRTSSLAVSGPDPEADRRVFLRNKDDQLLAIWNRCAHLGCPVAYSAGGDNYVCPCHGGAYDSLGLVVGGPPPRPLDRLAVRIARGKTTIAETDPTRKPVPGCSIARARPTDTVLVGRAYSIDAQQAPFSLHGPGEPVDGLLSNLYPFA